MRAGKKGLITLRPMLVTAGIFAVGLLYGMGIFSVAYPEVSNWQALEALATVATALAAGAALYWASLDVSQAVRSLQSNQLMEVWQHCASRYDTLKRDQAAFLIDDCRKPNADEAAAEKARETFWENFWSRYWGLKNDQFDFWLFGYLDHDTFCDWAFSTVTTIINRKKDVDFQKSLDGYLNNAGTINPLFNKFLRELRAIAGLSPEDAEFGSEKLKKEGLAVIPDRPRYNLMIAHITKHIVGRPVFTPTWKKRHTFASISWDGHLKAVQEVS